MTSTSAMGALERFPRRWLLILATFLLSVLLYVDRICISTAKGPVAEELGLSDTQFGWVLSAFALGYALLQTPAGALADRLGPRRTLGAIVALWSLFTGLTAAAWNLASMLLIRFLFGAGEAGAYPAMARAIYSWLPMKERGSAAGVNFSGSRLGAAFALPAVAWLIGEIGWKPAFAVLMGIGFVWALAWFLWFRDEPADHPSLRGDELAFVLAHRQARPAGATGKLRAGVLLGSRNLRLAMAQYFCSNFTFFFCLTWLFPHLKATYQLDSVRAGWYAAAPLVAGALGNVASGWLVDRIYRSGDWRRSRLLPAMAGFALSATGLVASVHVATASWAVLWFSLAIFGADMTLAPSWAFCTDIGRSNSGAVSGTMNMAGNLGSFVTSVAFPYLLSWTGGPRAFFYAGAGLNLLALVLWSFVRPDRPIEDW